MHDIKQVLEEYGLSEKESTLYLSSLVAGQSTMTNLAKRAGIKRSTAYLVFKSLEKRGLMGSVQGSNASLFMAIDPYVLSMKANSVANKIQAMVPDLQALEKNYANKPQVSSFEGPEAYKTVLQDALTKPNKTIRHIGSLSEIHRVTTEEYGFGFFVPTRIKQNIFLKALYAEEAKSVIGKLNDKKSLRKVKFLPKNYDHRTSMMIYDDTVVITSSIDELVTIVIKSARIAEAEKSNFDLIWDSLK